MATVLSVAVTDLTPKAAHLYFRAAGASTFQRLEVPTAGGVSTFHATLPATAVVSPAAEYYLEVTDVSGVKVTSPAVYPAYNPHRLEIVSDQPALRLVAPDTRRTLSSDEVLQITVESDMPLVKGEVSVILDDTDLTSLARVSGKRVELETRLVPGEGPHTLAVTAAGAVGGPARQEWTLQVAKPAGKTLEAYARGGISFNYGGQLRGPSGSEKTTASGNLGLSFGMRGEDWEATWNGINLRYVKDAPDDEVTIASGFHFTLRKGEQLLEYGDITVNETPLTAPSFARRGLQAKVRGAGTDLHLFNVSTATVSGWDAGIGDGDRQVYGFSLARPLLSDDNLPVTLVYLRGKNEAVNGYNAGGTGFASEGEALGATAAYSIGGLGLGAELAWTRFDPDISNGAGTETDLAGTGSLSGSIGSLSLGGTYFYYGPDFESIANPNFTNDRQGFSANAASSFGASSLTLSGSHAWDNVEREDTRPRVYSSTGSVSYSLAVAPWPALSVSFSRSAQDSQKTPRGMDDVHNTNDSATVGLSSSGERWTANLGGNWSQLVDRGDGPDSQTRGVNLSGSYAPVPSLNLSPSASYTENTTAGVTLDTRVLSLTANLPLWNPHVDASCQFSHVTNGASDDSQDSTQVNGSWRIGWNIHEFLGRWFDYGQETLALTGSYSRIDDHANPDVSDTDVTVFVSFNIYAPVSLSHGF
ncbi:MAG TPA: hypothetical protein VK997_10510 [Deferrisomatales bacterium]|nr:hypothetical protein [Deferrisomatales bacterium]